MNSNEITYWSTFYKNFNETKPSDFACFIVNYLKEYTGKLYILDVGCGNGRDSNFLSLIYPTTGIDISVVPTTTNSQLQFIQGDMTTIDKSPYNVIYSRFTFHSISNEQQEKLIQSILNPQGDRPSALDALNKTEPMQEKNPLELSNILNAHRKSFYNRN
jgi:trans-aconitate methyltransferase